MDWVKTDLTKSGYGIEVSAPEDGLETACLKSEVIETDTNTPPDYGDWVHTIEVTAGTNTTCAEEYMGTGYVTEGYVEGDTAPIELYVDANYVEAGYVEGACTPTAGTSDVTIHRWTRWLQDPVIEPYVRDGYLEVDINPVPCVTYTNTEDIFDDLYDKYPFSTTAGVMANTNLSHIFGLSIPVAKRKDIGVRAMETEGV